MADEPIFTKIASGIPTNISTTDVMTAREWFRSQAQKLSSVNLPKLFEQNAKNMIKDINITAIGSMFQYVYDPKLKEKLPYYDIHPLVFVVELYNDGWSGLNVHYLPPYLRAKLMDALYTITLKEKDIMKVQLSYRTLKSASKFSLFRPCYKRYLADHVRSRFMLVPPEQWDTVLMLPTQRFVKQSEETVWKDSRRMI